MMLHCDQLLLVSWERNANQFGVLIAQAAVQTSPKASWALEGAPFAPGDSVRGERFVDSLGCDAPCLSMIVIGARIVILFVLLATVLASLLVTTVLVGYE